MGKKTPFYRKDTVSILYSMGKKTRFYRKDTVSILYSMGKKTLSIGKKLVYEKFRVKRWSERGCIFFAALVPCPFTGPLIRGGSSG